MRDIWQGAMKPLTVKQLKQLVAETTFVGKFDLVTFERYKRQNLLRGEAHRGWPSHKPALYEPNGKVTVFETVPIGKLKYRGYCKYCYRRHYNWWAMPPEENTEMDGERIPIILCGECEHTSALCFT